MTKVQIVKESEHISTRLSPKEIQKIDSFVEAGLFLNRADFLRTAARKALEEEEILLIRDVDVDKAKKEIIGYLKKHGTAYPSEIADALRLDMKTVIQAVKDLWNTHAIEEVV